MREAARRDHRPPGGALRLPSAWASARTIPPTRLPGSGWSLRSATAASSAARRWSGPTPTGPSQPLGLHGPVARPPD